MDLVILLIVIALSLIGLLMVYDASQFEAFKSFGDKYYYIKQQSLSFVLGLVCLVFFSFFDYHNLQKLAYSLFIISVILLLAVFLPGFGVSAYGAHRWLKLAGFTIQPTEVIKLSSVILFSAIFARKLQSLLFLSILIPVTLIIGLFQKDLGSAVVFGIISFTIYFISGARLIYFLGLILAGIGTVIGLIAAAPYRIKRVLAFLDPFSDSQGYSYHITQVLIALGSGGLMGLGIGQSRQKFAYIPEVTTDSIFSIVGEEFGFLGGTLLISLFGFLVVRGFRIASVSSDDFGRILATGLTVWLGVQALVNLAAMVSLMPLTGVPLPFVSYGGSALIANLVAVGILLNISKHAKIKT